MKLRHPCVHTSCLGPDCRSEKGNSFLYSCNLQSERSGTCVKD